MSRNRFPRQAEVHRCGALRPGVRREVVVAVAEAARFGLKLGHAAADARMSAHALPIERCSGPARDAFEYVDLVKRSVHTAVPFTIGAAFRRGPGIRLLRSTFG